jgi:prepilin-type N-terminal cleavage/methylation domain-containing protein
MQVKDKAGTRRDRGGMTLVEMMIALTVFGMIMAVVMGFLVGSRNSYADTRERALTQQTARAVISLLTKEIRSAGCDPTDNGFDTFGLADANSFQCRMDLNGDGDFADADLDELVTWTYDPAAGTLSRDAGEGAQVILRGLTNLSFQFYDENGALIGGSPLSAVDRARVRTVEVVIQGETDRGEPVDYSTRVALRNI